MTDERDPILDGVFAAADEDLPADVFTEQMMARIGAAERWTVAGRFGVGLALAVAAVLVEPMAQDAITALNQGVQAPLVDVDDQRLSYVLAPVNSVQGVAALVVAALVVGWRTLFGRA